MEGLWLFLTICGVMGIITDFIGKMAKMKVEARKAQNEQSEQRGAENAAILARMEKLERRMANLETIVLDAEKKREYERL